MQQNRQFLSKIRRWNSPFHSKALQDYQTFCCYPLDQIILLWLPPRSVLLKRNLYWLYTRGHTRRYAVELELQGFQGHPKAYFLPRHWWTFNIVFALQLCLIEWTKVLNCQKITNEWGANRRTTNSATVQSDYLISCRGQDPLFLCHVHYNATSIFAFGSPINTSTWPPATRSPSGLSSFARHTLLESAGWYQKRSICSY